MLCLDTPVSSISICAARQCILYMIRCTRNSSGQSLGTCEMHIITYIAPYPKSHVIRRLNFSATKVPLHRERDFSIHRAYYYSIIACETRARTMRGSHARQLVQHNQHILSKYVLCSTTHRNLRLARRLMNADRIRAQNLIVRKRH